MQIRRFFVLVSVCVLTAFSLIGQSRFVRNFSVSDGLSQSEVSDIMQDSKGRILLNTGARGVDVFDGLRFKRLTQKDGLVSPFVLKIDKDVSGQIWFFSLSGLSKYGLDKIEPVKFVSRLKGVQSFFSTLALTKPGEFLIGTNNGLVHIEGGSIQQITTENPLKIFALARNAHDEIICGTDKGIYCLRDKKLVLLNSMSNAIFPQVYSITPTPSGALILGLKGQFAVLNNKLELNIISVPEIGDNAIISGMLSSENKLILGTNGNGLLMFNEGVQYTLINEAHGLHDNYIWTLFEDENANIWIGSSGGGVDVMSADEIRIYSGAEGINGNIVYDIHQDQFGRMWFGVIEGGLTCIDGKEIKNYGVEDGLSHRSIRSTFQDNDTLWIGTENGITIFHDEQFTDLSDLIGLRNYAIFDIHRAQDGRLWFACKGERYYGANGGVVVWDGKKAINYTRKDGLADDNVYCIHEKKNELWFGTVNGVSRWNGTSFNTIPWPNDQACQSTVTCMREDANGNTWLGTLGGLGLIQNGEYQCLNNTPGLSADFVFLLELEGDSFLWVGSSTGIERIDLKQFYADGTIQAHHYNDKNGFLGTECNQNAVCIDDKNQYWFGTIKGAVRFDPKGLNRSDYNFAVFVHDIKPNGVTVHWPSEEVTTSSVTGLPEGLQLDHDRNNIVIDFGTRASLNPEIFTYRIRLSGVNSNWSEPTNERSVHYTNLNPGHYTFQVEAYNKNSGARVESAPFNFEIKPAFWQTTLFKLVVGIALLFALIGITTWRLKSIRAQEKNKQEFQRQLHEVEMKALRAQMNPHFIFNSLNSVNHFILQNRKEEASAHLTKFSKLIRLVLQNSEEKLITLEEELEAMELYIQMEKLRFKDPFEHKITAESAQSLLSYKIPPLLLQPYVENAIWHGLQHLKDRKGRIELTASRSENGLFIEIEDNGVGREKAVEMRSKSTLRKRSMGMQINSERIRLAAVLYKGKSNIKIVDLRTADGKPRGTRIELSLDYKGSQAITV